MSVTPNDADLLHARALWIEPSTGPMDHEVYHSLPQKRLPFTRYLCTDEGVHLSWRPWLILQLQQNVDVWQPLSLLPLDGVDKVDNFSQQPFLDELVHHSLQLGFEDSGADVRTVKAGLARFNGEKNLLPLGVGRQCEEKGWLAQGADNGKSVLGLLHIPTGGSKDGGWQDDGLAGIVQVVI